jgi:hypothetical protein
MYHFTLLCLPAAKAGFAQKAYLVVFLFKMLFKETGHNLEEQAGYVDAF